MVCEGHQHDSQDRLEQECQIRQLLSRGMSVLGEWSRPLLKPPLALGGGGKILTDTERKGMTSL
ncbi:unnamed protein product [Ranitomeya imitator]|uniref:Uncharacterized protein n=1 Tax=Ranitomeya imitator TaxID=111125 RepID=A0ABN9LW83_9NEOB|nr:unnamed protein product [Ranitomeya imitator]